MSSLFSILGHIIYIFSILGGLLVVPLGLPGTWVIAGIGLLYSFISDFQPGHSDLWVIVTLVVFAGLGELLEFGVGIVASKKMDVSNKAVWASLIGGIVGAVIGLPVAFIGSLLGLLLGTFLGAFLLDLVTSQNLNVALKTGVAVFFSRVTALFVKTLLAFAMVVYLFMKTF